MIPVHRWWELLEHPDAHHPFAASEGPWRLVARLWEAGSLEESEGWALLHGAPEADFFTSIRVRAEQAGPGLPLRPRTHRAHVAVQSVAPLLATLDALAPAAGGDLAPVMLQLGGTRCGLELADGRRITWLAGNTEPCWLPFEEAHRALAALLRRCHAPDVR